MRITQENRRDEAYVLWKRSSATFFIRDLVTALENERLITWMSCLASVILMKPLWATVRLTSLFQFNLLLWLLFGCFLSFHIFSNLMSSPFLFLIINIFLVLLYFLLNSQRAQEIRHKRQEKIHLLLIYFHHLVGISLDFLYLFIWIILFH